MDDGYQDPLDPASNLFANLCKELSACVRKDDATHAADFFSGGFKFSDEFPANFEQLGERLPSFVDLLRCLWGYRASLVTGKPRQDLVAYWEAAKMRSPNWAGFSAERCSPHMKNHAEEAERRTTEIINELDRMDRELTARSRATARA
jgi:hypothetical protein